MFDFDIAVVIPMAGSSQRFPSSCPKQYLKISGKYLFMFCVEKFYKLPYIKKICLVSDKMDLVRGVVEKNFKDQDKIVVVQGGTSRHISIKNGITELSKLDHSYKVVVVHDGVRPIVPEQLLVTLITEAVAHGAAGATRPLVSTVVKPLGDGTLDTSLDRNQYALSETPQAFLFQIIKSAYSKCSDDELERGTECLQLTLMHCGTRAKLVPGPDTLWKVTDKKDFYSVAQYLKETSTDVCILGGSDNSLTQRLEIGLRERVNSLERFPSVGIINSTRPFNIVVSIHSGKFSGDHPLGNFASALDPDRPGLIIHVIVHATAVESVDELRGSGANLMEPSKNVVKGVVMIHYSSCGGARVEEEKERKLIRFIESLIFIDAQFVSGQTYFL